MLIGSVNGIALIGSFRTSPTTDTGDGKLDLLGRTCALLHYISKVGFWTPGLQVPWTAGSLKLAPETVGIPADSKVKSESNMALLRRKRNFVDFEVQTSLLRRMALQWVSFLAVNSLALYCWTYLISGAEESLGGHMTQFLRLYLPVLIVSAALLPVYLLDAAKLSNRFVGPILRVRRALAEAAKGGKVKPLHFRENDFWRSLADDLNSVLKLESDATATKKPSL